MHCTNEVLGCREQSNSLPINPVHEAGSLKGRDTMRRSLIKWPIGFAVVLTLATCGRELTEEELAQVENLRGELSEIDEEISEAQEDDERYSGGLVKSLIAVRLEILKTNKELVRQRIHAIESGAGITISTPSTQPDLELASKLEEEIAEQRQS